MKNRIVYLVAALVVSIAYVFTGKVSSVSKAYAIDAVRGTKKSAQPLTFLSLTKIDFSVFLMSN